MEKLKKFWKENTKGGVTVFICAILIPMLMFTGLMTDLARIKLFHSEASGTADAYADAVLSQYDKMLYNVYGLLAVTQNDEAIAALDTIREYMEQAATGTNLGAVTVGSGSGSGQQYIPNNINPIGNSSNLQGVMSPYGNMEMHLEAYMGTQTSNDANLSNSYVFADQVCDYMKVIGPADIVWNGIKDALNSAETSKENAELMDQRQTVDNNYSKLDDALSNLYMKINNVNSVDTFVEEFPGTVSDSNVVFKTCFDEVVANANDICRYDLYDIYNTITELETGAVSPDELLYRLECYRKVINASAETITQLDPELQNWPYKYMLTIQIEELEASIDKTYGDYQKHLMGGSAELAFYKCVYKKVNDVVEEINGNDFKDGGSVAACAADARSSKDTLLDMCKEKIDRPDKSDNQMAKGMKEEYSTGEGMDEEVEFVGEFDYDYLAGEYSTSAAYISDLNGFLENDKNKILEQIENLRDVRNYVIEYIDALENYIRNGFDETNGYPVFSYSLDISGLVFNGNYAGNISEGTNNYWFKITDGGGGRNSKYQNYTTLWGILVKWYGEGGTSEETETKTKEYKGFLETIKGAFDKLDKGAGDELIKIFDGMKIPESINKDEGFPVSDKGVDSLFDEDGNFKMKFEYTAGDKSKEYYITKLLMMDYDYNFFAGATFGKNQDPNNNFTGKTLKDESITDKTNYLVRKVDDGNGEFYGGAELEYIYWGKRNAQDNLKAVRNQIMIIRAVENYASTYSISAINDAIGSVRNALSVTCPIAALIVPPLIRAAIAMVETYADLYLLYAGESIALYKNDVKQLSLIEVLNDLDEDNKISDAFDDLFTTDGTDGNPLAELSGNSGGSGSSGDGTPKFNYSQYVLLVTMLFCTTDDIVKRTQDLVELNMNFRLMEGDRSKLAGITNTEDLEFRLAKAAVGVKTTCSTDKMNLLMLGGVYSGETLDEYVSGEQTTMLEKGFSYTVYRSY